jgi:hypothetical protein
VGDERSAAAVRPPAELGDARFKSRHGIYQKLLAKESVINMAAIFNAPL